MELGQHGGAVTLMTASAGGYTKDGEPFESGATVTAPNGNEYRLTLEGREWAAEFVPPAAESVRLGSSGDAVEVAVAEDRGFLVGGRSFESGDTVAASNGNVYVLRLRAGEWAAEFVPPAAESVRLGSSGDAVEVAVAEDRSFLVGGRSFESGDTVAAGNGNVYVLRLRAGEWAAEFVPPAAESVRLGSSGDAVEVAVAEDRSFLVGGRSFESGDTVAAGNGNVYVLRLRAGEWAAEFVPPAAESVRLGSSGDAVEIAVAEDRGFLVGGRSFESGDTVAAGNGNLYVLRLRAGEWAAEFVPPAPEPVALGQDAALVTLQEGGSYALKFGQGETVTFEAGGLVTAPSTGYRYRMVLDPEGRWSPQFAPTSVQVALGSHGGTITVLREADGRYRFRSKILDEVGEVVIGSNGESYRLTLRNDEWIAQHIPRQQTVALGSSRDSVTIISLEDGSFWEGSRIVQSGQTVTSGDGRTYELILSGNEWQARLAAGPIDPGTPGGGRPPQSDSLESYVGSRPNLESDADGNLRAVLEVGGVRYPLSVLFSEGKVTQSDSFAKSAQGAIAAVLHRINLLVFIEEAGGSDQSSAIRSAWEDATASLRSIFGRDAEDALGDIPLTGRGAVDSDEAQDTLTEVLEALSSRSEFEDALDDGVFSAADTVGDADEVFETLQQVTRLQFGWTQNTRFGAYLRQEREDDVNDSLRLLTGSSGFGAFAYSPVETSTGAEMPRSGQAAYSGATMAVAQEDEVELYAGSILLTVRFGNREVTARIDDLVNEFGAPWRYSSRCGRDDSSPNRHLRQWPVFRFFQQVG